MKFKRDSECNCFLFSWKNTSEWISIDSSNIWKWITKFFSRAIVRCCGIRRSQSVTSIGRKWCPEEFDLNNSIRNNSQYRSLWAKKWSSLLAREDTWKFRTMVNYQNSKAVHSGTYFRKSTIFLETLRFRLHTIDIPT